MNSLTYSFIVGNSFHSFSVLSHECVILILLYKTLWSVRLFLNIFEEPLEYVNSETDINVVGIVYF